MTPRWLPPANCIAFRDCRLGRAIARILRSNLRVSKHGCDFKEELKVGVECQFRSFTDNFGRGGQFFERSTGSRDRLRCCSKRNSYSADEVRRGATPGDSQSRLP